MSKKYENSLRLNLPTGEDCLRANAELQRTLRQETQEYADKMWDKVGGRIVSALIGHTVEIFKTRPNMTRASFDLYFIRDTVFDLSRKKDRSEEEIKAIVDVWHMFRRLPSPYEDLDEHYAELIIEKLRDDLESYGYDLSFSGQVTKYSPFLNPVSPGGWTHDYKMFITPAPTDLISRLRRWAVKALERINAKLEYWFPNHNNVRKRA